MVIFIAQVLLAASTAYAGKKDDTCRKMIPKSLQEILKQKFPAYRLPLVSDNDTYNIQYNLKHGGNGCIGVALGDFDNDHTEDIALLITSIKDDHNLLVVGTRRGKSWKVDVLRDWGGARKNLYVEAIKPGKYTRTEALEGPVSEPGEVEEFTSTSDGIVSGGVESSGCAYFLKGADWIHVWISD